MTDGLPRIGLSSCYFHPDPERPIFKGKTLLYVEQSMVHWVASAPALVYPVPSTPSIEGTAALVDDLDGLVLHGGSDVAPGSYGETPLRDEWQGDAVRDAHEIDLVRRFLEAGKPLLGICRGLQVLNVALGGTLYQDLIAQGATERVHRDHGLYDANVHAVEVTDGCRLASLLGRAGQHTVNSIHHQGIRDLAPGLTVEARSAGDGIVEAVRADGDRYAAAVQWHPEFFDASDDGLLDNGPILRDFVEAARSARAGAGSPA